MNNELTLAVPAGRRESVRLLVGLGLLILAVVLLSRLAPPAVASRFNTFVTIFLGILIEALPFLLAGSVVSGLIEVFVSDQTIARFIPSRPIPAAFVGALLGFTFPVCECGVVPVTRRLYQKGLPLSVGVAFLLAAPVVNPVVILSTYAAFGAGPILFGRLGFSILIAFIVGVLFSVARPDEVLLPTSDLDHGHNHHHHHHHHHEHEHEHEHNEHDHQQPAPTLLSRFWEVLAISGDDFLDMARYLILGSMLAATMQTFVPQSALLALGKGPIISVVSLMVLAFVLSICSTVDAFLALSFVNSFTNGSILAFLVFGPMVDIKSSLMFLGVFRRRTVFYLILLPLLLTMVLTLFVNLHLGW